MNKENILRGKVLDLLRKFYPDGVDEASIVSILFQYHKIYDIQAALEYLKDKEYLLKKTQPHPFVMQEHVVWYKISPNGIDLLEGNIQPDPGILVQQG